MKTIIFDLDGTLIDSLLDISLCANEVLQSLDCPTHPLERYKDFVGDGAKTLIDSALPKNISKEKSLFALEKFKELYDGNVYGNTKPYDGIIQLLKKLENENYSLNILSNKPHKFTLEYVNRLFGNFNFNEVHGQKDNIPKKPNPAGAVNISNSLNVDLKDIIYVGDTGTDMKTAVSAGMIPIGVLWGFRSKDELIKHGAKHLVKNPQELYTTIKKYSS